MPLLPHPVGGTFQEAAKREQAAPGHLGKRERRLASYSEGRRADASSDEADDPESGVESGAEAGSDSGNESDFHPTQDTAGSDGVSSEDSDDEELELEVGLCFDNPRTLGL